MTKLKWRKALIHCCTTLGKRHVFKGYSCGELGIYKLPDSKPVSWGIQHIKSGMYVSSRRKVPCRTMAEVKDLAGRLMAKDTWYIEGAEWGDLSKVDESRLDNLAKLYMEVLYDEGYKKSEAGCEHKTKVITAYLCDCGKMASRYMLSSDKKHRWKHYCLECQPYKEVARDGKRS